MSDANPASETALWVPWVVFASGQGQREEYGTTASAALSAPLEEEISTLCREFHNALGVQELPDGPPVVLFWKARQSSHRILTQVLRAPHPAGQRAAYEYFNLALTEADFTQLGGNPLQVAERLDTEELRVRLATDRRDPISLPLDDDKAAPNPERKATVDSNAPFVQNGTWPATRQNREALLAYITSGAATARSFATWWPGTKPPRAGLFDIVLLSDATRAARPHEILAIATELNHSLSRSLPAPPSHDAVGGRIYRAMLHDAEQVQEMLQEAYTPAALEESPHRWMTRPQKIAGLCEKLAVDLPDYASRLPAYAVEEQQELFSDLADRYRELAGTLQKLRHPNLLHQSRGLAVTGAPQSANATQIDNTQNASRKNSPLVPVLLALLLFCLLGLGARTLIGKSGTGKPGAEPRPAQNGFTSGAKTNVSGTAVNTPSGTEEAQSDAQAIAIMQARAEKQVFQIARGLAASRTQKGKNLSNEAIQAVVMDAVAQAMSQTPHAQIKPAQKELLFRMASAVIRAKAMDGARAGIRQGSRTQR